LDVRTVARMRGGDLDLSDRSLLRNSRQKKGEERQRKREREREREREDNALSLFLSLSLRSSRWRMAGMKIRRGIRDENSLNGGAPFFLAKTRGITLDYDLGGAACPVGVSPP